MASIVEAKVGNGKLLLCTMDINENMANWSMARQLKYSLLLYMQSNKFNPATVIDLNNFQKIVKKINIEPVAYFKIRIRKQNLTLRSV